jgi:hypothetical protein
VHSWNTFGARMSHEQTRIHKTHHGPDLGEATIFPFVVFFVPGHRANTQMLFCPRTPKLGILKFPKLGLPRLWMLTTSSIDLRLRWGQKQSFKSFQELSNNMWHASYTQINLGDSWRSVVGNQIGSLIPDLFFGHNLCFKYPNGSCEHFTHLCSNSFPMI